MSDEPSLIIEVEKEVLNIEFPIKEPIQVDFPAHITIINNGDDPTPPSVEAIIEDYEAGSNININRVIALRPDGLIVHADKDNLPDDWVVIGVSKTSGAAGQQVQVVRFGKLTGASLGAIAENLFLGNNGGLTSVAPVTGNWLMIGIQETASEFFVNIGQQVQLY